MQSIWVIGSVFNYCQKYSKDYSYGQLLMLIFTYKDDKTLDHIADALNFFQQTF